MGERGASDTMAALQAMLVLSDTGALLRFVQRPNAVDLDEGSMALRTAGRYSELIALLQNRSLHDSAMELLQTMSLSPDSLEVPAQGESLGSACQIWQVAQNGNCGRMQQDGMCQYRDQGDVCLCLSRTRGLTCVSYPEEGRQSFAGTAWPGAWAVLLPQGLASTGYHVKAPREVQGACTGI